jgi:hypothetical protein
MCSNLLTLNQDKTELMIFAPKHRAKELKDFSISFGGNIIRALESDKVESMDICWDLLLRYDFIHANADPDIPKVYSKHW